MRLWYYSILMKQNKCVAVLDIDSDTLDSFDEVDAEYLKQIVAIVEHFI